MAKSTTSEKYKNFLKDQYSYKIINLSVLIGLINSMFILFTALLTEGPSFTALIETLLVFIITGILAGVTIKFSSKNHTVDKYLTTMEFNDSVKNVLFCLPCKRVFLFRTLEGLLYFKKDGAEFISKRVIGSKIIYFNHRSILRGKYDLDLKTNGIKLYHKKLIADFIYITPYKSLKIDGYRFLIPPSREVEDYINLL